MLEPSRDSMAAVPESQAPTIAPSRSSFEKDNSAIETDTVSGRSIATPGGPGQAEVESITAPAEVAEAEIEKHGDLARAPTSASHAGGKSLQPTQTREDGSEYPTGLRLGLISLALCLAVFLMALDNSIIATAIPKITDQFQSLGDVGWYGSGKHWIQSVLGVRDHHHPN